jgi:endonuclease/exonuclease/phosphatase family metal-dependent hydrolase
VRRLLGVVLVLAVLGTACSGNDNGDGGDGASSSGGTPSVRAVSQNILHGTACAPATDGCALPDRVALFVQQLEEGGCPELVGLQEANGRIVEELTGRIDAICDGRYEIVHDDDPSLDREVVLTTLPVIGTRRERLAGPLRTAFWVRVAADVGVVDFVTTHLASSSDDRPCDRATCPPPCTVDDMLNLCQARQVLALVDDLAHDNAVVIVGGDLNAQPGEPTIELFADAGYVDTHLAAGNPECDPATGEQCTSGRVDDASTDLENPQSQQSERIDFLWLGPQRACEVSSPTGLFNGEPADGPLAYPSDHTGVEATLTCETSDAQHAAADDAPLPTTSTTVPAAGGVVDEQTRAAITTAFETLFNGDVTDPAVKLSAVEDAELLRPYFLEMFEATKDIASRIHVRLDDMQRTDATNVAVVYTLLLDDQAVLDHLPGNAVLENGTWLVSRSTYCTVSTQGATEIPEPCRS